MTFELADELLERRLRGEEPSPVGARLTAFARGVAVYEMPVREDVRPGVIAALAEEAMHAAALSALPDGAVPEDGVHVCDLRAEFRFPVRCGEAPSLRAEAIVTRAGGELRVVADVLYGERRVASFECECARALG